MKKKALTISCEPQKYVDIQKLSEAIYSVLDQKDNLSAELEFVSEEEIAAVDADLRQHMLDMRQAHKEFLESKKKKKSKQA